MLPLYNTLLLPLRVVVGPWAALQVRRDSGRAVEWAERLARRLPAIPPGGAWIHGASLGEARVVDALARALRSARPGLPLAVSASTAAGRARLPAPPTVDAAFHAPLDFASCCGRVLDALQPTMLALVETELWPNLLAGAHARGVPVTVLNARLAARRMARYRRLRPLYRPLLARVTQIGAQSAADAARFVELGVPSVVITVTGNIKYDLPLPREDATDLRARLALPAERPVFVAGSTGAGEDALVLDAFAEARRSTTDLLLVLAPRHLPQIPAVERLVLERGWRGARISERRSTAEVDVLLVDTHGELASLYCLARVAFVGGSLVPLGGHNVLEPAAVGVPVLFGPHTESAAEAALELERAGGARRVHDALELGRTVAGLLADPERARAMGRAAERIVERNRGALDRSVALLVSAPRQR